MSCFLNKLFWTVLSFLILFLFFSMSFLIITMTWIVCLAKQKMYILHFCVICFLDWERSDINVFWDFHNHVHSQNNLTSIAKIEYFAILYSLFLCVLYHLAVSSTKLHLNCTLSCVYGLVYFRSTLSKWISKISPKKSFVTFLAYWVGALLRFQRVCITWTFKSTSCYIYCTMIYIAAFALFLHVHYQGGRTRAHGSTKLHFGIWFHSDVQLHVH